MLYAWPRNPSIRTSARTNLYKPSTAMTDQPTADTDVTSGTVPNVTGGWYSLPEQRRGIRTVTEHGIILRR